MNPGKKLVVFLLVIIALIQSMSLPLIYLNFEVNREFIAAELCVNRDKPITVCGGLCYLGKQFDEQQQGQETGKTASVKKFLIETFFEERTTGVPQYFTAVSKRGLIPYLNLYQSIFSTDIFHPPLA